MVDKLTTTEKTFSDLENFLAERERLAGLCVGLLQSVSVLYRHRNGEILSLPELLHKLRTASPLQKTPVRVCLPEELLEDLRIWVLNGDKMIRRLTRMSYSDPMVGKMASRGRDLLTQFEACVEETSRCLESKV